jgi:hypothetical protein
MPFTPKQLAAQAHNRLMGHTAMMKRQSYAIMTSPTVSSQGQAMARKIHDLACLLDDELRTTRIDP